MARKALPAQTESTPLVNTRHELLAQRLARGDRPIDAYVATYKNHDIVSRPNSSRTASPNCPIVNGFCT